MVKGAEQLLTPLNAHKRGKHVAILVPQCAHVTVLEQIDDRLAGIGIILVIPEWATVFRVYFGANRGAG